MGQLQATGGSLLMDCLIGLGRTRDLAYQASPTSLFLTPCMTGLISSN